MNTQSEWTRRFSQLRQRAGAAWAQTLTYFAALTAPQRWIGGGVLAVLLLMLVVTSVSGGRNISVNGQRLSEQEIAYFDASFGARVPDGQYWFDPNSMQFGMVGAAQPMGAVGGGKPQSQYGVVGDYGARQQMQARQYDQQMQQQQYEQMLAQQQYEQMLAQQYQQQMQAQQQQQQQSWGDVGQNDRGPFGDYMSDGECSFVNGIPVGNC